jgi:uncharacterized protein (TIGR03435 family)
MVRQILGAGFLFVGTSGLFCQQAAGPAFEAASVKPSPPITGNNIRVKMGGDPGRVNYSNATLRMVLSRAYNVKMSQISGPDWINTERFEIVATVPPKTPAETVALMLQNLLAERFQMKVRREQKVMPVYALVPGKGGSKMRTAEPGAEDNRIQISMGPRGRRLAGNLSMSRLVDALSNAVDRPVVDMTNLKGIYDVDLEWAPDEGSRGGMLFGGPEPGAGAGPGAGPGPGPGPGLREQRENSDAPTIFTAVQEKLGLKLESRKAPVDMIVVEHAEKVPTEN